MNVNREDLAWAGGFFSGEGSTYIRKAQKKEKTYWDLRMSISQTSSGETLERFRNAVGLGKVYGPYKHINKSKDLYLYHVDSFQNVQAVVGMIWPWLSTDKQNQAKNILNVK